MNATAKIPGKRPKVVVAMSGGVDSSVAAALLQEQGYDVVGCFMRLGSEDDSENSGAAGVSGVSGGTCDPTKIKAHHQGCCSVNDAADARFVAAKLGVPFYVLNFRKDFDRIIDYFVAEYNAGRTPNPCVRCNDWLKLGKLFDYAQNIDADFVATGHYARIDRSDPANVKLLRGTDHRKDQSYVLFGTQRNRLCKLLLPIGELEKPEVRKIAEQKNLPVFNKPDSQEICFVPDNDYASLVTRKSPEHVHAGKVLDEAGKIIGQHPGQQHFTIGQRRGLGVAVGLPLYVTKRDAAQNTITVGSKESLLSTGLKASQPNWLVTGISEIPVQKCQVKIRYNSPPVPATLFIIDAQNFSVQFDTPQSAVTPGQAVVCFDNDIVLGGGWITMATNNP